MQREACSCYAYICRGVFATHKRYFKDNCAAASWRVLKHVQTHGAHFCRFEKKDMESTRQANDWKAFVTGKGKKKKAGFMTGTKKESIFSVPDNPNSKVGVVGSGRGMTNPSGRRTKLDF